MENLEQNAGFEGGFSSPVFEAQASFRAVMDGMARPGTIQPIPVQMRAPAPLKSAAAAVLCTLCDADTSLWLSPICRRSELLKQWLGFQTGSPITDVSADAHFAVFSSPAELTDFNAFALGTQEYPDRSTTLIVQVESLLEGETLTFKGPGIRETAEIAIKGLSTSFVSHWRSNNALFPRGVDIIFCCGNSVLCLPRSIQLVEGD